MADSNLGLQHRLAVVWFADLVGWSSLASRDEDRALALVRRFQAAVGAAVQSEGGRVVKFIGDAALVESPSAESALRSAAALRESLGEGEEVRTGVHLGDVAVAGDGDLYGDGVNTAQRIQTEAEPSQILVSEDVARGLRSRPAFRFESVGQRSLKGIEPTELFLLVGVEATAREAPVHPRSGEPTPSEPRTDHSIAVLPFANLSADPENEYFSDGVTEEILTALTKLGDLKVISRTSVMQYKGTTKSVRQIGSELEVGAVLEGSIRRAGNRVRITAQLIEALSDRHLWAENYDRELDDIFAIQTDVAQRIVGALKVHLTPRERARIAERPTEDVEAYQWFLKGRHFLASRTLPQAIDNFRRATDRDSSFAPAWAGLALAYSLLPSYVPSAVAETAADARAAAERALALDPGLSEAHAALGQVASQEWDWVRAEAELRRAIELSPGVATAHHWYGMRLAYQGRHEEAIEALRRALELDPLSQPIHIALGMAYAFAHRHAETIELWQKAVELDPGYLHVHEALAEAYDTLGRYPEALAAWDTVAGLNPELISPALAAGLRSGFEAGGSRGYWEAWGDGPWSSADSRQLDFFQTRAFAQLGRHDEAFKHLDRVVEERSSWTPQITQDPVFEPLRSDPRFDVFLEKIHLK